MYPFFGEPYLADVINLAMKEFVDHISSLAPATIRDYVNIVKSMEASARDRRGEPLFMRDWDYEFIDAPEVDERNQPTVDGGRNDRDSAGRRRTVLQVVCVARGLCTDAGRGSTRPRHSIHP